MKFGTLRLVFVVAAFGAVGLAAQDRPNFSGTWIAVGPQQAIRELTIKHDGSTLSLEGPARRDQAHVQTRRLRNRDERS